MLLHKTLPLPRYSNINLSTDKGHAGCDEAHVRQTLLHYNSGYVGTLHGITSHIDPLQRHGVPFGLPQRELPVQLQVERVIGAHLHVRILLDVAALQPQHARLRVEVDVLHADGERGADPVRRRRSGGGLRLHLAHRRRPDRITLGYEVVRVPHVFRFLGDEANIPNNQMQLLHKCSISMRNP